MFFQPATAFGAVPCAPSIREGAVYSGVRDLSPKEEATLRQFLREHTKSDHCIDLSSVDLSRSTEHSILIQVNYLSQITRITKNLCRATYYAAEARLVNGKIRRYSESILQTTPEEISSGFIAPSHYYWLTNTSCSLSQATERGIPANRLLRRASDVSDVEYLLHHSNSYKYASSNTISPAGCFDSTLSRPSYDLFMLTRESQNYVLGFLRTRSFNNKVMPGYCVIRVEPTNLRNGQPLP